MELALVSRGAHLVFTAGLKQACETILTQLEQGRKAFIIYGEGASGKSEAIKNAARAKFYF